MARTTLALTSFVSGELGSKLDGRTDFDKYRTDDNNILLNLISINYIIKD